MAEYRCACHGKTRVPRRIRTTKWRIRECFHRRETFKKRTSCSAEIQNEINKQNEINIEEKFVKEIPPQQVNHDEPEWYLPIHAVFTPDRSTKIRLVFDASAKGPNGKSLNEHLQKGPNYMYVCMYV